MSRHHLQEIRQTQRHRASRIDASSALDCPSVSSRTVFWNGLVAHARYGRAAPDSRILIVDSIASSDSPTALIDQVNSELVLLAFAKSPQFGNDLTEWQVWLAYQSRIVRCDGLSLGEAEKRYESFCESARPASTKHIPTQCIAYRICRAAR